MDHPGNFTNSGDVVNEADEDSTFRLHIGLVVGLSSILFNLLLFCCLLRIFGRGERMSENSSNPESNEEFLSRPTPPSDVQSDSNLQSVKGSAESSLNNNVTPLLTNSSDGYDDEGNSMMSLSTVVMLQQMSRNSNELQDENTERSNTISELADTTMNGFENYLPQNNLENEILPKNYFLSSDQEASTSTSLEHIFQPTNERVSHPESLPLNSALWSIIDITPQGVSYTSVYDIPQGNISSTSGQNSHPPSFPDLSRPTTSGSPSLQEYETRMMETFPSNQGSRIILWRTPGFQNIAQSQSADSLHRIPPTSECFECKRHQYFCGCTSNDETAV